MKKLLLVITLILLFTPNLAFSEEEVKLNFDENFQKLSLNISKYNGSKTENTSSEITLDEEQNNVSNPLETSTPLTIHSGIFESIKKATNEISNSKTANYDAISPLFKEQMTKHFETGPLESLHVWAAMQNNFEVMLPEGGEDSYSKYNMNLLNFHFDGKTRSGQDAFRLMLIAPPQQSMPFMRQFVQDAYFETKRIPHHTILIGNSRVGTGFEGVQSTYTIPFLNRAQIARNHANIRKKGLRIRGNFKYIDYDTGVYSSDTYFSEFMPGIEYNGWVNFKPFTQNGDKHGKLIIGNGISAGKRNSTDYFVYGAGIQYNYKKFWTRAEFSVSDGSNGASGLSSKRSQGWYVTLGYRLNKKTELLIRYDEFDPDKSIGHNNRREYSAGLNYYIKGQALKLVLNYIYCQNQASNNSHRILIGAQIAL